MNYVVRVYDQGQSIETWVFSDQISAMFHAERRRKQGYIVKVIPVKA